MFLRWYKVEQDTAEAVPVGPYRGVNDIWSVAPCNNANNALACQHGRQSETTTTRTMATRRSAGFGGKRDRGAKNRKTEYPNVRSFLPKCRKGHGKHKITTNGLPTPDRASVKGIFFILSEDQYWESFLTREGDRLWHQSTISIVYRSAQGKRGGNMSVQ